MQFTTLYVRIINSGTFIQTEASEWVRTATLLTNEVQRHPVPAILPLGQQPPADPSGNESQPQPPPSDERQPVAAAAAAAASPSVEHAVAAPAVAAGDQQPAEQQQAAPVEPPITAEATAASEGAAAPPPQQQQPSSFGAANVQHLGEDLNTYLKAIIQDPKHVWLHWRRVLYCIIQRTMFPKYSNTNSGTYSIT